MSNALFASLRLAIAIVCIGISLVLAGYWLNLFAQPLRLLAFYVVAGVAVYWVFLWGVVRGFEFTQVVPDRIRESLDSLAEGLLIMDEFDRIVLANDAFSHMVGLSRSALIGRRAGSLNWICSPGADNEDFPWHRAIHQGQPQVEQLMRYRLPDGSLRFFSINASMVIREDGKSGGSLATFRDVTRSEEHRAQREQMLAMLRSSRDEISTQNQQLQILASQDALTGCLNRRAMGDAIGAFWQRSLDESRPISCLMLDNDHFKSVNDNFGHPIGDDVLQSVAEILNREFVSPALVCRYGGEEFCVMLPDTKLEAAAEIAESVRVAIEAVRIEAAAELKLTASIGVSETRFGAKTPAELIAQADESLYVAKASGRNRVVTFGS